MKSILDAMLAQYVDPYQGEQAGMGMHGIPNAMGAGIVPPSLNPQPGPQMGPPQPGPQQPMQPMQPQPQQAPQPPANPLEDVEGALLSGLNTPEMQARAAFEEGVAPFEDKWRNTQERRFGGWAGGIETIADWAREKKLRPQRQAVDAQRARMTQEAAIQKADQMYKDARAIIGNRNSNLPPDVVDAMARRYAQGEDLSKLAKDTGMDEYQQAMLDMKKREMAYDEKRDGIEANQDLLIEKHKEGVDLSKRLEPSVARLSKAQEVMARLQTTVENYATSPASVDINVMYDFIKSIDPESVVREGEVRLGQASMGYQSMLQNAWDKVTQDQALPANFMADLANQAMKINEGLQESAIRDLGRYYNMAQNRGYDMIDVFGNESLMNVAKSASMDNYAKREAVPITGEQLEEARERGPEGATGETEYERWKREQGL